MTRENSSDSEREAKRREEREIKHSSWVLIFMGMATITAVAGFLAVSQR